MTSDGINSFWLILALLTALTIYWLWTQTRRDYLKFNVPPFPVKPWPFFGHFFMLFGDLRNNLKEWRKSGGDIYSLDLKGQLHILVNNFNDIKEIWIKHADHIVNLQRSMGDDLLHDDNKGITSARDDNWKEQRAVSLAILRSFGMGKNIMANKIQEEVTVLIKKLADLKGQPENVRLFLNISVCNIISSISVGERFDYNDPHFMDLVTHMEVFMKYFAAMMMLSPFKQVCYLPGDLFNVKKWARACTKIAEEYTKPYLRKSQEEFSDSEDPRSFIAAYLLEMKKAKEKGTLSKLDEENLIVIIRTLFAAGTDTTSTTILWCLLYMIHYPEWQEKVYSEIENTVGTDRAPNMADKPKLRYLNAVIFETQRYSRMIPVAFRREVSKSFEYGGYTFPKGSCVWPILDSVFYDTTIWGDPHKFRPDRFIDKNGSLITREEFIPFGIGKRICLGEALAKMEMFLFLAAIFQRFKIEPEDRSGELPSLKENIGTLAVPLPFKLRFIERKV